MPDKLEEKDWNTLMYRIKDGKCTPFLGAGACYGTLPLGKEIAKTWAGTHEYPLDDLDDLARVSQYLAVDRDDAAFPKEQLLREFFEGVIPPDFKKSDEPHGVLADLPLPVYMTTNYDDYMIKALMDRKKDVKKEICRWNSLIKDQPSVFENGFRPSPANPVVFHLHGHKDFVNSLVLTEDDYLDFLVNVSRDDKNFIIPPRIQEALTGSSLLFIGYGLSDWDFRVLFRGLVLAMERSQQRISITVQVKPKEDSSKQEQIQRYLNKYFGNYKMKVYWGTARKFSEDLRTHWENFKDK